MKSKTVILVALMAILLLCFLVDPNQHQWVPKCPFKLLTGWSCPGCGIQRAAHAVLHGNMLEAVQYNWFLVLSLPYALLLVIAQWCVSRERSIKMMHILANRYAVYTYMVLFFIWFVVRNLLDL